MKRTLSYNTNNVRLGNKHTVTEFFKREQMDGLHLSIYGCDRYDPLFGNVVPPPT